jgi:hypothetical protein
MHLLRPPDLSTATQVIGLDGLPTVPLWNLLLATGTDFDHWQVIDRDERTSYIESGLNMDLVQIGSGIHPYSGGRTSPKDPARLRYVTETEGEFALVSSKEAIQDYEDSLDLRPCLRPDDGSVPDTAVLSGYKALHYSLLKSSNAFKKEPVGVIMGSPSPNDRVIQRWAGFCGQPAKPEGRGEQKSFGEFGDRIYEHFVHDRIAQALFRFGRDESVWANGGATVYISTTATHDWLPVDHTVQFIKDGEATVVKTLRAARYETDRDFKSYHTISTLDEELDLSQTHLRSTVEKLTEKGHVDKRPDAGPGGADLYRWVGTEPDRRYTAGELSCLTVGHDIYLFDS